MITPTIASCILILFALMLIITFISIACNPKYKEEYEAYLNHINKEDSINHKEVLEKNTADLEENIIKNVKSLNLTKTDAEAISESIVELDKIFKDLSINLDESTFESDVFGDVEFEKIKFKNTEMPRNKDNKEKLNKLIKDLSRLKNLKNKSNNHTESEHH